MTFSEYALALSPFISYGKGEADYFTELIGNYIEDAAMDSCQLLKRRPDTKYRYIKGSRLIKSKDAQYLYDHRDNKKFSSWIEVRMDETESYDKIDEWLKQNGIHSYHAPDACAELLEQIILSIICSIEKSDDPNNNPAVDSDISSPAVNLTASSNDNSETLSQMVFNNLAPALQQFGEAADILTRDAREHICKSGQAMSDAYTKAIANLTAKLTQSKDPRTAVTSLCDTDYYHLIVTCCEIHGEKYVDITHDRGLKYRGTAKEILERCADLSTEAVDELKSYPAIICNENTQQRGVTDKNQLAILAHVMRICIGEKEYRIRFYPIATFPQSKLNEYAVDFGLSSSGTLTTLNTSHWCVKKNNLSDIFDDTGIEFSRYILLYKSSILQSEIPKDQTELLVTDFCKFNIGSYQTIYPSMWTYHLENDQVYRITTEFNFDERYIDGKRTIILSAAWNNITISGKMSAANWTSESYMNNCADAGKKTVTAIFKVLNYETNTVQYLLVFEVK